MTREEKLRLFADLVESCHTLYLWAFDESMHLQWGNSPAADRAKLLLNERQRQKILEQAHSTDRPSIMTEDLDVTWIVLPAKKDSEIESIYALGPFFVEEPSYDGMTSSLRKVGFSQTEAAKLADYVRGLPVLSLSRVFEYAIMLQRCVTDERISASDLEYRESRAARPHKKQQPQTVDVHGTYAMEREMLRMVREGDPKIQEQISRLAVTGNMGKLSTGSSMRQMKNAVLVNIVLFSRAAIEGGLPPEISMMLTDHYFQSVEGCRSMIELREITATMQNDFVERVRRIRTAGYSKPVTECCAWIDMHLEEDLTLKQLAETVRYSEYYLSRRFRREVGMHVKEYIRQKRLERAKTLLDATDQSISEIASRLHFCSQSYFTETFQAAFGMTPSRFRKTRSAHSRLPHPSDESNASRAECAADRRKDASDSN